MGETSNTNAPLFSVRADIRVTAQPDAAYAVVTDLTRSAEWSVECLGGRWISGPPAQVGSVFRGENTRSADVVAWAPVVRGKWSTESEVVATEPGRVFRWAIRDSAGNRQDSVWSFEIEPRNDGCLLIHHFRMGTATEGIRGITAEMDENAKRRFFAEWSTKLAGDLAATLDRIKIAIEKE
ncbi:MAG TPA: SRPBCC family protein [Pseudonocardiaceae bacterium]|nr:SRPBCC family protein [Pseudonocardiaceae bacterium]